MIEEDHKVNTLVEAVTSSLREYTTSGLDGSLALERLPNCSVMPTAPSPLRRSSLPPLGLLIEDEPLGRGVGAGLGGRRLPAAFLLPPMFAGPCLGGHRLVQLPVGRRAALPGSGVRHRGVDGRRHRVPLDTVLVCPPAGRVAVGQHARLVSPPGTRCRERVNEQLRRSSTPLLHPVVMSFAGLTILGTSGKWCSGSYFDQRV